MSKTTPANDWVEKSETVKGRKEIIKWCYSEIREYQKLIKILEKQNGKK